MSAAQPASATPSLLALIAVSAVVALLVAVIALTRGRRLLAADAPGGAYKRQTEPVPMVGGFCLAVAALATAPCLLTSSAFAAWGAPFLAGFGLALAVGHIDDRGKTTAGGLPWPAKLAGQALAAGSVLLAPELGGIGAALWLLLCMNAWNFADNTDGAATATGVGATLPLVVVLGGAGTAEVLVAAVLTGTLLGFLPVNWPRARAYLGDAGSHGLGFALGWLSLAALPRFGPAGLVALHALPLLDFAQVSVVRIVHGLPPWRGDRRHVAHRMQNRVGVTAVAPLCLAIQALVTAVVLIARA